MSLCLTQYLEAAGYKIHSSYFFRFLIYSNEKMKLNCLIRQHFLSAHTKVWGRDSVAGITIRYAVYGPEIESRWRRDFHTRPDRPLRPPSLQYNGYLFSFRGPKRPGCGADHSTPSSVQVKRKSRAATLLLFWAIAACSRMKFTFLPYT
jgi:hypothetical protein